jgi:DNA polymerase-1
MKRVMIVDALNMYFRAYIVDPSLSTNGHPIGGVKGFLKILQKLSRDINPDMIVMCWDGPGGSRKRRQIVKEYKQGRKPIRLNRESKLSSDEELVSKVWQQTRLLEYLNELPIAQFMFPEVEADDVVAYAARSRCFKGWQKIIVSSDKDFLQLCDEETVLFRPIQKKVHNLNNVVVDYGIHPVNFALARAIAGDKSDNLKGVPGAGLPTVKKRLPFLSEGKEHSIQEVMEFCENVDSKVVFFDRVISNKNLIIRNYKMMQLYDPTLSLQTRKKVDHVFENLGYEFNKTEILKMMNEDGFGVYNWGDLFAIMNRISVDKALKLN